MQAPSRELPMLCLISTLPLVLLAGCASGCQIARGLYSATVQRSGQPPRAEVRALRASDSSIGRALPSMRVVVLPVAVLGRDVGGDSAAAARLADSLVAHGMARSARAGMPVPVPFVRHPNEAMIFWTRFRALQAEVRAHPPADADLVLLVDVFGTPGRALGAVHAMGVGADGALRWSGFWNSHQPLWKEVRPVTVDDALRMVVLDAERSAPRSR